MKQIIKFNKMSLALKKNYSNHSQFRQLSKDKKEFSDEIYLICSLNKKCLDKVMQKILIGLCDNAIVGYDKMGDKYWCKKYYKSKCYSYIELKIILTETNKCTIKINLINGNIHLFKIFINDFKEDLNIYPVSKFLKFCADKLYL